jgi:hypothetical protein
MLGKFDVTLDGGIRYGGWPEPVLRPSGPLGGQHIIGRLCVPEGYHRLCSCQRVRKLLKKKGREVR